MPLWLDLCRSTNRRFGAFTTGFVSQYKPYNWAVVSVKTGGSVPLQTGFVSQYTPCNWVSVTIQTGGSVLLQLGISPNGDEPLNAFRFGFLSQ